MSDIVERARAVCGPRSLEWPRELEPPTIITEMANEIEALRARLEAAERERAKLCDGVGAQLSQDATLATINLDLRSKLEAAERRATEAERERGREQERYKAALDLADEAQRARAEAEAACAVMREALRDAKETLENVTIPQIDEAAAAQMMCDAIDKTLSTFPATARLTADVVAKARALRHGGSIAATWAAVDALDAARVVKP